MEIYFGLDYLKDKYYDVISKYVGKCNYVKTNLVVNIIRMLDLNSKWIDIECPKCGYQDFIQLIDVKTEKTIFCHNCKATIILIDNEASVHQSINQINNSINEISKIFKNFGK